MPLVLFMGYYACVLHRSEEFVVALDHFLCLDLNLFQWWTTGHIFGGFIISSLVALFKHSTFGTNFNKRKILFELGALKMIVGSWEKRIQKLNFAIKLGYNVKFFQGGGIFKINKLYIKSTTYLFLQGFDECDHVHNTLLYI